MIALVDANNLVTRCHYANPTQTSRSGKPTGAVFGFIQSVMKILKDVRARAMLIVWDGGRSQERMKVWPEYKANRKARHAVYEQGRVLRDDIVPNLGVPQVRVASEEADDLIGVAVAGLNQRFKAEACVIISADRDFYMLIDEDTSVFNPMAMRWDKKRGLMITSANFRDVTGLPSPEHYLDFKALVGDTSDNIPGVPGIGEKTATELINAHGTIADILDKKGEILRMKPNIRVARMFERENLKVLIRNLKVLPIVTESEDLWARIWKQFSHPGEFNTPGLSQALQHLGSFRMVMEIHRIESVFEELTTSHRALFPTASNDRDAKGGHWSGVRMNISDNKDAYFSPSSRGGYSRWGGYRSRRF